jgi:8-hydroxy-5-deazaflavin:NADPH oxidoreductase
VRIAVIGAGRIGGTVGAAWQRAGHEVTFGVREPGGRSEGGPFATPEDAVQGADVVVFAVPGTAMDSTLAGLEHALPGKILVDATNQVRAAKARSAALEAIGNEATPVFRAFNSLGWEIFANPKFGDDVADLFYAGPDVPARHTVKALISDVGSRPIYVGADADVVDGALRLWFALVTNLKAGRGVALKVLTR